MTRHYFRPIQERTVISVLHYLREVIVRESQDGLEHVDALLRMQGVDPEALPMALKTPKAFKRGELRRMILEALRCGPQTGAQLAERIAAQRDGMTVQQAYKRVYIALHGMHARGMVRHEGRLWLAP